MHLLHKFIFALTVCFVSLSLVLGAFGFYATNSRVLAGNLPEAQTRTLYQTLRTEPFQEDEFDYQYSLVYLLTDTLGADTVYTDFEPALRDTVTDFSLWLRGDTDILELTLPSTTDTTLQENLDPAAAEFIDTHKPRLEVCAGDRIETTQQEGYSPGDFCIPSQVRNNQIDFTTYVNAQPGTILDDVVRGDLENGVRLDPGEVEFLAAYQAPRFLLVTLRQSLPLLVILSVALLAVMYYSQKLQRTDVYLGFIRLLGYVAVSVISLALLGVLFFNTAFLRGYLESNSLPGLNQSILDLFASFGRGVVIDALAPSFIIGGLLSIVTTLNYFVYNRRKIDEANDNELFQLHEHDIYDQSVLLATKPSVPTGASKQPLSKKQLETLERIKDHQAAQNYHIPIDPSIPMHPQPPQDTPAHLPDPAELEASLERTLAARSAETHPTPPPLHTPTPTTKPTLTPTPRLTPTPPRPTPRRTVIGGDSKPLIESSPESGRRTITF